MQPVVSDDAPGIAPYFPAAQTLAQPFASDVAAYTLPHFPAGQTLQAVLSILPPTPSEYLPGGHFRRASLIFVDLGALIQYHFFP